MVSRDASSGSRQTFERYVLQFPEKTLSSNFCVDKDRDPTAAIIRCERDSTTRVLDEVNRIPGAIGYTDATQAAKYRHVSRARLDGLEPTAQYVNIHVVCQMAASRAGVGSCERGLSGVGVRWSSVGVSC
jgi:ABC-type phosphate transport system substrate-binding protein